MSVLWGARRSRATSDRLTFVSERAACVLSKEVRPVPSPPGRAWGRRFGLLAGLAGMLGPTLPACRRVPAPVRSPMDAYEGFRDAHPSLLVTNPRTLLALETDRFSLGDVLAVRGASDARPTDYSDESANVLARSRIYADLVATLDRDLTASAAGTSSAGVGPRFAHRLFDRRWLTSPRVHFELVGIVNRIDFRSLVPPGCGQTRLVYRLAYRPPNRPQTRLPLTLSVIYENRETRCDALARRWLAVEGATDLPDELRTGPLARLDVTHFDRVEVDVQSMRENSRDATMDDHAEYILRGFDVSNGRLVASTLRNTPRADLRPDEKEALRQWVGAHLEAIDVGAAELPQEYLAERAVSVTPRGLSRNANRPFAALFPNEDDAFGDLPLAGEKLVRSPWMLVRRLDEMTCVGCHQSRTVAGFHLLGEDRTAATTNGIVLGTSEHLREILDFRFRFLTAAAEGRVLAEPVPLAEHPGGGGQYGAHCTVEDATSTELPDWPCAPGFLCEGNAVDDDPIGQCVEAGAKQAGDPCEDVALTARPGPDGDAVAPHAAGTCAAAPNRGYGAKRAACLSNHDGFPGGMCSAACTQPGDRVDGSVCVKIPHRGFERECFAPNAVLESCLDKPANRAITFLRSCSRVDPCRDDFVCGRIPTAGPEDGACVPPYFIFQARVDGPPLDR
jgi:hypothetical protein